MEGSQVFHSAYPFIRKLLIEIFSYLNGLVRRIAIVLRKQVFRVVVKVGEDAQDSLVDTASYIFVLKKARSITRIFEIAHHTIIGRELLNSGVQHHR